MSENDSALNELKAQAAAADSIGIENEQGAAQQIGGVDYDILAAQAVDAIGAIVCGLLPAAAEVWADDRRAGLAGALAPVMRKYGWESLELPPEVVLAFVAVPMLWATGKAAIKTAPSEAGQAEAAQGEQQQSEAEPTGKAAKLAALAAG